MINCITDRGRDIPTISTLPNQTLGGFSGLSRVNRSGISNQYKRARNPVGLGLSYRPARLHSLADWFLGIERFMGSLKV
jgi:hypothetical protein